MKRFTVLLFASAAVLAAQSTTQSTLENPPVAADRVLLVTLGLGDRSEVDWSGSLEASNGEVVDLIGYEMGAGDLIRPPHRWEMATRPAFPFSRRNHDEDILVDLSPDTYLTPRFHVYLNGTAATRLRVRTAQGDFELELGDIPPAGEKSYLDGRARVQDSARARARRPRRHRRAFRAPNRQRLRVGRGLHRWFDLGRLAGLRRQGRQCLRRGGSARER